MLDECDHYANYFGLRTLECLSERKTMNLIKISRHVEVKRHSVTLCLVFGLWDGLGLMF